MPTTMAFVNWPNIPLSRAYYSSPMHRSLYSWEIMIGMIVPIWTMRNHTGNWNFCTLSHIIGTTVSTFNITQTRPRTLPLFTSKVCLLVWTCWVDVCDLQCTIPNDCWTRLNGPRNSSTHTMQTKQILDRLWSLDMPILPTIMSTFLNHCSNSLSGSLAIAFSFCIWMEISMSGNTNPIFQPAFLFVDHGHRWHAWTTITSHGECHRISGRHLGSICLWSATTLCLRN